MPGGGVCGGLSRIYGTVAYPGGGYRVRYLGVHGPLHAIFQSFCYTTTTRTPTHTHTHTHTLTHTHTHTRALLPYHARRRLHARTKLYPTHPPRHKSAPELLLLQHRPPFRLPTAARSLCSVTEQ